MLVVLILFAKLKPEVLEDCNAQYTYNLYYIDL